MIMKRTGNGAPDFQDQPIAEKLPVWSEEFDADLALDDTIWSYDLGVSYDVEYKSSLTNAAWLAVETIVGDGNTNSVSYPVNSPARFYRVSTP